MDDDPFVFEDVFRFSLITQGRGKKVLVIPEVMDAVRNAKEKPLGPPRVQTLLLLAQELQRRREKDPGLTYEEFAKELGVTRPRIHQVLQLLKLAPAIQEHISLLSPASKQGVPSERALRPLCQIADSKEQADRFWQMVGESDGSNRAAIDV